MVGRAPCVPNLVEAGRFETLRRPFDEAPILEFVAVRAPFRFLNRWNDTMPTDLETTPLAFAEGYLEDAGWEVGKDG